MAGIYVADSERLSLHSTFPMFAEMERKHGSLIKAMRATHKKHLSLNGAGNSSGGQPPALRPRGVSNGSVVGDRPQAMFTSLRGGMQELVDTLVAQLECDLYSGCPVIALRYLSPGFEVIFDSAHSLPLQTDAVVLAIPAYAAATLVEPIEPQLAALLAKVRYVSTATISLGYRRADISPHHDLNGFGFMVPKSENRQILACTWSSTKFDHRAPADNALIRLFVGGDHQDQKVDQMADEDLIALAQAEVAAIMDIRAQPVIHRIFRWLKGNPQYDVGHLDRVLAMEQLATNVPSLYLTGSAFRGIGLPDCVKSALTTVERLMLNVQR